MNKHTKDLIKDTLALLGGVFTSLALIEPWVTEKYHILRFKGLITLITIFIIYRLVIYVKNRFFRISAVGITIPSLLLLWVVIPTFPMNLLAWIPSPEEREFLEYSESMTSLDAYKYGMISILNNDQEEAKKGFELALKGEAFKPYALNRLAFVERLQSNDERSLALYDEAIKFSGQAELLSERKTLLANNWQNRGFLYRRLANAIRDDDSKWQEYQSKAFQSFQSSLEHDPLFSQSWYMLGQIHYDRGELEAAKETYYRAYFINSQYDRAAYNIASLEADLGNIANSLKWVKRTLQINATQAYALEEDESFEMFKFDEVFNRLVEEAKESLEVMYRSRLEE